MSTLPKIRKIQNGEVTVVDYGLIWFRINPDGSIIKKSASEEGVTRCAASTWEVNKIKRDMARIETTHLPRNRKS